MNVTAILLAICFLPIIPIIVAIFYEPSKKASSTTFKHKISSYNEKTTNRMAMLRKGRFLMHILDNNGDEINDNERLENYRAYIKRPPVINFIQNVKGVEE